MTVLIFTCQLCPAGRNEFLAQGLDSHFDKYHPEVGLEEVKTASDLAANAESLASRNRT